MVGEVGVAKTTVRAGEMVGVGEVVGVVGVLIEVIVVDVCVFVVESSMMIIKVYIGFNFCCKEKIKKGITLESLLVLVSI